MKISKHKLISVLSLGILSTTVVMAQSAPAEAPYVGDEIIVKYKPNVSKVVSAGLAQRYSAKKITPIKRDLEAVQLGYLQSVESAIESYQRDSNVEYAQPNYKYYLTALPNDNLVSLQWHLKNTAQTVNITNAKALVASTFWTETVFEGANDANPGTVGKDLGMEAAWAVKSDCRTNEDGEPVIVAVMDSGVNYNHPDLMNNMWDGGSSFPNHGKSFVSPNTVDVNDPLDPMDQNGHGSAMSGIIAAQGNNTKGVTGICQRANIMAVKTFNHGGGGATSSTIANSIDYAVQNGAKVINVSASTAGISGDPTVADSIQGAKDAGVLIVAAAGNAAEDNDTSFKVPCSYSTTYDNIICVAAVDQKFEYTSWSGYGDQTVTLGAPGKNIVTTYNSKYSYRELTQVNVSGLQFLDDQGNNVNIGTGLPWSYASFTLAGSYPMVWHPSTSSYLVQAGTVDGSLQFPTSYAADSTFSFYSNAGYTQPRTNIYDSYQICWNAFGNLASGDQLDVAYEVGGSGNPFAGTPTIIKTSTGSIPAGDCKDITPCVGASCRIGFQLTSTSSAKSGNGVILTHMRFSHRATDIVSTTVPSTQASTGTSPATAVVSGVATLLFAANGNSFTYLDVKNALIKGGVIEATLATKTKTGKVVSAIGALAHIEKPTGVTASAN
jgi:thermitase